MSGCDCPDISWRDVAHGAGICGPDALALSRLHLRDVHFVRPSTAEESNLVTSVQPFLSLEGARKSQVDIIRSLKEQLDVSRVVQGALQAEIARLRNERVEANSESVQMQLNYIRASRLYRWMWRFRRLFRSDSLWVPPANDGSK